MAEDPDVVEEKVTEHEPPESMQLDVVPKLPLLAVHDIVPVGVLAVPGDVSATVAVQLLCWVVVIELGVQVTVVLVDRLLTVIVVVPDVPAEWVESTPYGAVIVCVNVRVVHDVVYGPV